MDVLHYKTVNTCIKGLMGKIRQPAQGLFQYPSLTTTAGKFYSAGMFTWDTHHMTLRFAMEGQPEMMKYFLLTMFQFQRSNGFVPCVCSSVDGGSSTSGFHAQPYLAQNAAEYLNLTGDLETVKIIFGKLKKYLEYWLTVYRAPLGLFCWGETWMSGFDNEITGTIFPTGTILPPDLPSLLYLECRAMGYLARKLDLPDEEFEERAKKIRDAVNEYLWDEEAGIYSSRNLCTDRLQTSWSDGSLNSSVGKYAYVSCPSLLVLFAGIANKERAERMIGTYVLSSDHFRSRFGIRSLSRSSEYYNNARWGNPPRFGDWKRLTNSNWQGPVWIPLNWFVFHGLLRYGFRAEAEKLADDTVELIYKSFQDLGFMRENYDAETGEGLYADQFASWNLLADSMHRYLNSPEQAIPLFPWENEIERKI